jgi:thiosulfate/3-mercaptopyruvate sulfurtransferase
LVVDVAWLAARLGDEGVQVVDARLNGFPDGHIPGALPLSPYALATTVEGVDFQVVGAQAGAAALAAIGLRPDGHVVVYGVPPEYDPARVVWALRYLGHGDVRYLDGGWNAWVAADAPIAAGPPEPAAPSDYAVDDVREEIRVTGDWVLEQLGDPPYDATQIQIVDARSTGEFATGRIPTAVHVQWTRNLEEGLLRSRQELETLYDELALDPTRTTVVYCLAGWRASVAWLTLAWLGFEDVRIYDGSWLEWGAGGRFPIDTGDV